MRFIHSVLDNNSSFIFFLVNFCAIDGKGNFKRASKYCPEFNKPDSKVQCVIGVDRYVFNSIPEIITNHSHLNLSYTFKASCNKNDSPDVIRRCGRTKFITSQSKK